jgi:hypothetical protein
MRYTIHHPRIQLQLSKRQCLKSPSIEKQSILLLQEQGRVSKHNFAHTQLIFYRTYECE